MSERKSLQVEIKDAEKGVVEAVFATMGVKDKDNDWTLPGAFGNQNVRVSSYGHGSWMGELPVGRGKIREEGEKAIAEFQFFMSTTHGREHFEVVKGMGDLQEWSYGYDVVETGEVTEELRQKGVERVLKNLEVHEVSPVLIGAGVGTSTLSVKGDNKPEKEVEPVSKKTTKLGELVKQLRDEQEISNGDLAEAMGIPASDVGRIIDGEIAKPSLARLEKAASRLKTGLSRLRGAAESDGCDYTDEDEMRAAGSAYEEARAAALKAVEVAESSVVEAKAAVEAKTAEEAKAAAERAEAAQMEAGALFERFERFQKFRKNWSKYTE